MSDKTEMGRRIKVARVAAGYTTIRAFAEAVGCDYTQIVRWEKGAFTPRTDALMRIASVCGVSMQHLLGIKEAA